jgi:hypothetical protein
VSYFIIKAYINIDGKILESIEHIILYLKLLLKQPSKLCPKALRCMQTWMEEKKKSILKLFIVIYKWTLWKKEYILILLIIYIYIYICNTLFPSPEISTSTIIFFCSGKQHEGVFPSSDKR